MTTHAITDFDVLLEHGHVQRDFASTTEAERWRAAIRREARGKAAICTYRAYRPGGTVIVLAELFGAKIDPGPPLPPRRAS